MNLTAFLLIKLVHCFGSDLLLLNSAFHEIQISNNTDLKKGKF